MQPGSFFRLPLAVLCLVGLLPAQSHAAAASRNRPNVLILVSDDQGWADIGLHNPNVHSPRLDALARTGAVFTQHYVMPQCTPTRVALLTGRYPSRFGGAALVAVPLIARLNDKAPFVMPGATVWYVFATAGFVGGLVYWMVAGRSA